MVLMAGKFTLTIQKKLKIAKFDFQLINEKRKV